MGQKDWTEWIGKKEGLLTVVKVIPAKEARKQGISKIRGSYFLCQCECGTQNYVYACNFVRGHVTSCGKYECRLESKRRKRALRQADNTALPDVPIKQEIWAKGDLLKPAIVARLKPKYYCPHPAQECAVSSLCHVCCWECDKACKSCDNRPEKCGATKRKKGK